MSGRIIEPIAGMASRSFGGKGADVVVDLTPPPSDPAPPEPAPTLRHQVTLEEARAALDWAQGLSVRTLNCLAWEGHTTNSPFTMERTIAADDGYLLRIPNFGRKCLQEVRGRLLIKTGDPNTGLSGMIAEVRAWEKRAARARQDAQKATHEAHRAEQSRSLAVARLLAALAVR